MRRKSLVWKLFPVYFAITLASVLIVGLAATSAMRKFYYSQIREDLAVRARLVHDSLLHSGVLPRFDNKRTIGIRKRTAVVIQELARSAKVRITLISKSGEVIADSHLDPAGMSNHSYRPEVHKALSGEIGTSRRLSKTLGITMFYVAIPIKHNGQIMGVLRVAQPANAIDSRPTAMAYRIVMISLATAVLTVAMSLIAARRLARAIAQIRNTAAAFANGDFSSRAPVTDIAELAGLADSLNSMAGRIEVQLRDMARQSAQQTAILASMREGVLAVADDDRILILNQAAADLLNVTLDRTLGRPLQEAVRNPALNRFIEQIRRGQQPADEDRVFRAQRDRLVQMNAAELRDPEGKHLGVLIVMSDITQSAKLDQMRREFVANVSHELKTPITAIKGYVETLLESKNLDQSKAREFLETTARQADRLNTIIDDLLKLAEIEQKAESAQIEMQAALIRPVLEMAAANCRAIAIDRKITIEVDCPDEIHASINPPLLERAVTNLIDNAVKYSPEGALVRVVCEQRDEEIAIRVIDNGLGIPTEHIPRLFERFYRVDTARSRKLGGTGLGLAIVKHIAQAHEGRVDVESVLGEGSTFTIYLPTKSVDSR